MSQAIHLIARSVPGYGPSDGRCLPFPRVSSRVVGISTCCSHGNYKRFSQAKIVSLRCISKSASIVCHASSSSHRRNPDFSRQSKHGFSQRRNRKNEESYSSDNLEESELFSSKNGPLLSVSGTSKFQATATPGPREKEILELFRKVQAQLRERAAIKEEKKIEDSQAQSKENETVDSLLKLLRKHSVQRGKRSSNGEKSRDFILDQPEQNDAFSEEKSTGLFDSNNSLKHEFHASEEGKALSPSRPKSNFQRRSPVPEVKFQPINSDEDSDYYVSHTKLDAQRKDTEQETKLKFEPEPEVSLDTEPNFSDEDVFDGISEDETSDIDEGDDDAVGRQSSVEYGDLSQMKLTELRALAKSRGIKGFSKLKKHELVELLTGATS